ncbi:MAG: arylsulfotransferase family protein [Holophagae bacterium]|jgi:hypothetical protein
MTRQLGVVSRTLLLAVVFIGGALVGATLMVLWTDDEPAVAGGADADRPENLRQLDQLASLPYLSGVAPAREGQRGVVEHDVDRSWPGLNFFNCSNRAAAYLIDMDGHKVFEWSAPSRSGAWKHAELLPSGDVLALIGDQRLIRVTPHGDVLWDYEAGVHHDLWVTGAGEVYLLARSVVRSDRIHPSVPVFADEIHVLDVDDGSAIGVISILDAVLRSPYAFLLPSSQDLQPSETESGLVLDVLHANHVEVFDGSLESLSPLYRAGNILVSMRTISAIGIMDPTVGRFIWMWGPTNIARQHHPTLLDTGHILLFDNGQSASQVIELDPLRYRVVWRYAPVSGFYSEMRGSVQRLPNGNTLITESDPGVVLEVTPEGDTVWRYLNPLTTAKGLREPIWRMTRYAAEDLGFLDELPE